MVQENPRGMASHKLARASWLVYMGGRILQGIGLLLIWWVLLLFANASDVTVFLYGGFAIAIACFYVGVACTTWAKKTHKPMRNLS